MAYSTTYDANGVAITSYIPTKDCPYGCAVNGVCGTETECNVAGIVGIVIGCIFGVIFLVVGCVICCCCCAACKAAAKTKDHSSDSEKEDDFKEPKEEKTGGEVVATYYA